MLQPQYTGPACRRCDKARPKNVILQILNRLCVIHRESILSRLERSGNRIEGCGLAKPRRVPRTLRYASAGLRLLRMLS